MSEERTPAIKISIELPIGTADEGTYLDALDDLIRRFFEVDDDAEECEASCNDVESGIGFRHSVADWCYAISRRKHLHVNIRYGYVGSKTYVEAEGVIEKPGD